MGLISFGGLGSGLDVNSIVDALVEAERAPLQLGLDRQEASIQLTLSGLGSLKSSLSELRKSAFELTLPSNYNKRSVTLESKDFYSVTANSSALTGKYDVEVKALATGTKLSSKVFTGGASTTFGVGTLTFTIGANSFDLVVGATDSLQDIRNNINNATNNIGVSVNILNNVTIGPDTGSLLTFASNTTGAGNDLVVTYSGDASLADLADNLNTDTTAADANIIVDGFSISSNTNVFNNVLDGVNITAIKTNTLGETKKLTIALDTGSVKSKVTAFVDALNAYSEVAKLLGQAVEGDQGLLVGDSTLRQIDGLLRNTLSNKVNGANQNLNTLSSLGITTTRTGSFELNSSTLDTAIANNFESFDELFTGDDGFATRFVKIIDQYTNSSGTISSRVNTLNNQLERIGDQRIAQDYRIDLLETRLREQFALMDTAVAQFNSTASFLTQQLANLPGFSSGKKK